MKSLKKYFLFVLIPVSTHLICWILLYSTVKNAVNKHNALSDYLVIGMGLITILLLFIGLRNFFIHKKREFRYSYLQHVPF